MSNDKIFGVWANKYEAYCEGRLADPYPLYTWLLEHYPVHWSEQMQSWFCGACMPMSRKCFQTRACPRIAPMST